jgi:hypothetical protein
MDPHGEAAAADGQRVITGRAAWRGVENVERGTARRQPLAEIGCRFPGEQLVPGDDKDHRATYVRA